MSAVCKCPYPCRVRHLAPRTLFEVVEIPGEVVENGISEVDLVDQAGGRFGKVVGARRYRVAWCLELEEESVRRRDEEGLWKHL